MKFNWGTGIVVTFALFFLGLGVVVWIAMSQRVELVREDYYAEGLGHEKQIDRERRSAALGERVAIAAGAEGVTVRFPAALDRAALGGRIEFYRPADERRDFSVAVAPGADNRQLVPAASLEQGLWRVKLRWTYMGKEYYDEDAVMIQ